jgi:hypothetical protein
MDSWSKERMENCEKEGDKVEKEVDEVEKMPEMSHLMRMVKS